MKKERTKIIIFSFLMIAMIALVAVMVIDFIPLIKDILVHKNDEESVVHYIEAYGIKGIPILVILMMLQVIITIIPAMPFQMLAGLSFGTWMGALISMVGLLLGNLLVFFYLKQFGKLFDSILHKNHETKTNQKEKKPRNHELINLKALENNDKPERLAFILYLIPIIPNGMLPYFFVKTKITLPKFLLAATIASIPSIIISTFLGESLSKGNFVTAIIIAVVLIIIGICIFLMKNKFMERINRDSGKDNNDAPHEAEKQ